MNRTRRSRRLRLSHLLGRVKCVNGAGTVKDGLRLPSCLPQWCRLVPVRWAWLSERTSSISLRNQPSSHRVTSCHARHSPLIISVASRAKSWERPGIDDHPMIRRGAGALEYPAGPCRPCLVKTGGSGAWAAVLSRQCQVGRGVLELVLSVFGGESHGCHGFL